MLVRRKMREIKFRAWIFQEERMADVLDLEFRHNRIRVDHSDMDGSHAFYSNIGNKKPRYILMQYTGLKDNNGKEIYEGDVLHHNYYQEKGIVIWHASQSRWALEYSDKKTQELFPIDSLSFKILGNIYENPELFK
jgi:uncharacterized phage protein (TIGR01671 family)